MLCTKTLASVSNALMTVTALYLEALVPSVIGYYTRDIGLLGANRRLIGTVMLYEPQRQFPFSQLATA